MADSIISRNVVVPNNYVGVCTANIVNAPSTITHNLVRSWDYNGTQGASTGTCVMTFINPSSGVYNWVTFDELFTNNTTKQIIFCLGAVPDYLVSRAATGGSYKGVKGNMCPDNLSAWSVAVTAVVTRAKLQYGRKGLIWQLWNEIDQPASYNDSISLLGPYTKATVQAIKAVDPTAICIGPTIAGAYPTALPFSASYISASDGAGATSAQWLDGVSFHYYNQSASQISQNENPINYANMYRSFQSAMANSGCYLPIYISETGVISADPNGGRAYARRLLTFAAMGAKCCLTYRYDDVGYPINIYVSQFNAAANLLNEGAVISRCELGMAKMYITINGTEYIF
jgi:Cellulase (glycosyl hydrolase family 5)